MECSENIIALVGNPNTGKSTVFNALTGLRQHTGNWTGKTVTNMEGYFEYKNTKYTIVDLPGMYSVSPISPDEKAAVDFMLGETAKTTVVVADASCLARNLILVLQIIDVCHNVIVCLNLMDEAEKKKIKINIEELSTLLGVPVVATSARSGQGLTDLKNTIHEYTASNKNLSCKKVFNRDFFKSKEYIENTVQKAEFIYSKVVTCGICQQNYLDRKIDKVITSKKFGIPIMIFIFGFIFWLTIIGANYPSSLLSSMFNEIEQSLTQLLTYIDAPKWVDGLLIKGTFRTLAWVVSVMLPPMAIFFPLFTFLEDLGLLPRIAFNLDKYFKKAKAHGKQVLTMCLRKLMPYTE